MSETTTRWTVSVSRDTDIAVRSFLAQRGMKKGDLSKFIEEAVKWRVMEQTVAEARAGFADLQPAELQALLDEAVEAGRASPRDVSRLALVWPLYAGHRRFERPCAGSGSEPSCGRSLCGDAWREDSRDRPGAVSQDRA